MRTGRSWIRAAAAAVAAVALNTGPAPAQEIPTDLPRGFQPGLMHPDLWLPDLDGSLRSFSEFGGKKLFIFHFASW